MTPIDPKTQNRISGALALAESASNTTDGERIAAINAAERMLAKANLRLCDLVVPSDIKPTQATPNLNDWREISRCCLKQSRSLTTWEFDFVGNLGSFTKISPRQNETLLKIAMRLGVVPRKA